MRHEARRHRYEDALAAIPLDAKYDRKWFELAVEGLGKREAGQGMYDRLLRRGMSRAMGDKG